MKIRSEREVVGAAALDRDIKRGPGGIREIEFITQSLQLLHAGRYPFLQTPSTAAALESLARYNLLAREDARFVVLHSSDGYTTNLALEDFAAEDALLAHSWSGQPLSEEHGGPVRLVVPHLYFWKSAKWLQAIEFVTEDAPGFWEVRGYHNRGDPWAEQRYSGD